MRNTVILLDRDGTLIEDKHYLHDPDGVVLLPGVVDGLRTLSKAGARLVVVSNQAGVGRGYYDEAAMHAVNQRLRDLLAAEGITLHGIYCCPHAPDADCDCRKPAPGMVIQAARDLDFDPHSACVIGDKPCDIELGCVVGAISILVSTGYGHDADPQTRTKAHFVAADLSQAADWLLLRKAAGRRARDCFQANIRAHTETLLALPDLAPQIDEAARLMLVALRANGTIFFCGNGGSAADAQHFAAELTGRFAFDRPALPGIALHTDTSALTAIANDYGYEQIFARQIYALGKPGDVLVGLTTSGDSPNVVRAMEVARERGLTVIAMTGQSPGKTAPLAHVGLAAPASVTARIQELHEIIGHTLCEIVEVELFGKEALPL